ncbi:hypothetical protein K439DRAFT_1619750 [Ramaria rubella]|nr:hypothetical protein K439DRAFT_1619750 [Ramaria rubella]
MHIREHFTNSYSMETLEGLVLQGLIHAFRLRRFIPRCTTELARLEHQARNAAGSNNTPDAGRTALADEIMCEDGAPESKDGSMQSEDKQRVAEETDEVQHTRMHVCLRGQPVPVETGRTAKMPRAGQRGGLRVWREGLRQSTRIWTISQSRGC